MKPCQTEPVHLNFVTFCLLFSGSCYYFLQQGIAAQDTLPYPNSCFLERKVVLNPLRSEVCTYTDMKTPWDE